MINPFDIISNRLKSIETTLLRLIENNEQPRGELKYYTIKEASVKLGLAEITLYRQVNSGKIPCKRIGSRVMIPSSFIEKL